MNEPVLVVIAAGMGSRYGGMKQVDPVGPSGESLMDYSLYDAKLAGFQRVVFVIKREMEHSFKESIGNRVEQFFHVDYVFQEMDTFLNRPIPEGRIKPWGTGHAVLAAKNVIHQPFAVINADDCYGRDAFAEIYQFLKNVRDADVPDFAMVGYRLENTLTENGYVSRGICTSSDGYLEKIEERTHITKNEHGTVYTEDEGKTWVSIDPGAIVSMNLFGFTEGFMAELEKGFIFFLDDVLEENPLKGEYYLPAAVNMLLQQKKARVRVLQSGDKWYGMTYKEDKKAVTEAINRMVEENIYPKNLWGI